MQCLQVLSILTALMSGCAATVWEPGNNDQYVEGQSRWVWLADGKGRPTLVDLKADDYAPPIDGSLNQYWLLTRHNPVKPQIIVHKNVGSVRNSNYNAGLPLIVLVHGWSSNGNADINTWITAAFLETMDANVIVVDWIAARQSYLKAVKAVFSVGQHTGNFLNWLLEQTGTKAEDVHILGHSLGAHVAGTAGRLAKEPLARVTGLDPAGPLFQYNPDRLNTSSGVFVETINTNGRLLGIFTPLGHANFYPNGGRTQPGCWWDSCSHSRAYELFAATVCFDKMVGKECKDLGEVGKLCKGKELHVGNGVLHKTGGGIYSLLTGKDWPFQIGSLRESKNSSSSGFRSVFRTSTCRTGYRRRGRWLGKGW